MMYELMQNGEPVGMFAAEVEAMHHAAYMPQGCYTIREWRVEGDFLVFSRENGHTVCLSASC